MPSDRMPVSQRPANLAGNIFLVGYRCTGKTSVGRLLARQTGRRFVDTDVNLTDAAGMPVADIVRREGWEGFRRLEAGVMATVCADHGQVVATGGGVVVSEENRALMAESGVAVWLKAATPEISRRLLTDAGTADQRPGLTAKGLLAEIDEVMAQREPLYANVSDFSIHTDRLDPEAVCQRILERLRRIDGRT